MALVQVADAPGAEAGVAATEAVRPGDGEDARPAGRRGGAGEGRGRWRDDRPRRRLRRMHDDERAARATGAALQRVPARVLDVQPQEVAPPPQLEPVRHLHDDVAAGLHPAQRLARDGRAARQAQHDDSRLHLLDPALGDAEAQLRQRRARHERARRDPQRACHGPFRGPRNIGAEDRAAAGLRGGANGGAVRPRQGSGRRRAAGRGRRRQRGGSGQHHHRERRESVRAHIRHSRAQPPRAQALQEIGHREGPPAPASTGAIRRAGGGVVQNDDMVDVLRQTPRRGEVARPPPSGRTI